MSIFGSRYKTQVGTSVSRVIEDDALPNSVLTGATRSLLTGDGQLVENAVEELAGSLATRVNRMYRYGKNQYVYGLPSGTTMTNLMGKATIDAAIEAEVGLDVTVDYYHFGPANLTHLGWLVLVRDYGYNSLTNALTIDGKVVFLSDMQPVVVEATLSELENGSLDVWGKGANTGVTPERVLVGAALTAATPSPFVTDPAATADYVRVKYCWEEDEIALVEGINVTRKVIKHAELVLTLAGFDLAADYHQARYLRDGRAGYWVYRVGSNLIPAVENIFATSHDPGGTFFPFAYLRYDKKSTAIDKQTNEYKSTRRLLKTINVDFDDMAKAIDENPDIKDVEQAILTLAVPAKSDAPIEQRYLFDFFDNLYQGSKAQGAVTANLSDFEIRTKLRLPNASTGIVIQDAKFKMALAWRTITKRRVAGSIGDVGAHAALTNIKSDTQQGVTIAGITIDFPTDTPTHIYRRQITEGLYEEILVTDLKMTYHIWGDYTTTGDENDDILMIPLDHAIIESYSLPDRELLAARSLHLIFNSRVVTKLKWYQTGIFRAVLIFVAIVITAYNIFAGIKALAAALTVEAAIKMIAIFLLKYALVTVGLKLFVKLVGVKFAFIVAIVAAVVGIQAVTFGAVTGVSGAPWATELLQVSSGLTSAMNKELKADFKDVANDFKSFQEYSKAQTEKLDKANDLLDNSHHLIPMVIWGERPDDFYNRTVHSGNIGVVGVEAIESYVDVMLALPKISDTLEGFV